MKKTISVITGSRAEFGLLRNLINELISCDQFEVKLIVTGTHLSKIHGYTLNEILESGFEIYKKITLDLTDDDSLSISKATAFGINSFAEIYKKLKPDLIIILGDRYEILSSVIPAVFENIPIAHIGGGEITEGHLTMS